MELSGGRRNEGEMEENATEPPRSTQRVPLLRRLYVGHFFGRWGPRMWEFSVGLYMIHVWPNSLLFAAIYGAIESASTALFGPIVGQWVDHLTYVKVLRIWCLSQFLSFTVAGGTVIGLLFYPGLKLTNFVAFISLVVFANVTGAVGVLSNLAGTILIEREWVVVIAEGRPAEVLTQMNSVIRRIDLICKLFAPVVSGFIISFVSLKASAMALAMWNVLSVWLQYWLLISLYGGIPALRESSQKRITTHSQCDPDPEENSYFNDGIKSKLAENWSKRKMVEQVMNIPFLAAWRVYLRQDVVLTGVSLALLYFTVLSFGTLMTATLEWKGIPTYVIGIGRGISATIGVAATILYPRLHSHIGTLRTGLWSIWSQWALLWICVASVFVQNHFGSAYMLMAGVATSRLGLWMFDLSVTQLMQDHIPESGRCVVGGVQNSLQSIFDLMAYVMGIIFSNPQDFWKLTLLSFSVVTLAALLYNLHVYRVRKHIFHFEKLPLLVQKLIK